MSNDTSKPENTGTAASAAVGNSFTFNTFHVTPGEGVTRQMSSPGRDERSILSTMDHCGIFTSALSERQSVNDDIFADSYHWGGKPSDDEHWVLSDSRMSLSSPLGAATAVNGSSDDVCMPHHGALLPSDHDMFFPFMLEDEVAGNAMEFEASQIPVCSDLASFDALEMEGYHKFLASADVDFDNIGADSLPTVPSNTTPHQAQLSYSHASTGTMMPSTYGKHIPTAAAESPPALQLTQMSSAAAGCGESVIPADVTAAADDPLPAEPLEPDAFAALGDFILADDEQFDLHLLPPSETRHCIEDLLPPTEHLFHGFTVTMAPKHGDELFTPKVPTNASGRGVNPTCSPNQLKPSPTKSAASEEVLVPSSERNTYSCSGKTVISPTTGKEMKLGPGFIEKVAELPSAVQALFADISSKNPKRPWTPRTTSAPQSMPARRNSTGHVAAKLTTRQRQLLTKHSM